MVTKRDWLLVIATVFLVWMSDLFTKMWAVETIRGLNFYGPFGLVLHRNPGAMLGMFADLPPLLRVVSLSTGGAFLVFIYASLQYLIPSRSMVLRVGMSILLGGILGNVTDRIIWGSVVDFLILGNRQMSTPAFNIADAVQWVGYAMIVVSLVKEGHQFWPESNVRKQIWVNPSFQLKYVVILLTIGLGFSIISGVFSYTYLRITIEDLVVGRSTSIEDRFLQPFITVFTVISVSFAFLLFLLARVLSHRTAGPLYAFEKYLEDIIDGKDRKLKLRAGDEFGHLEELADQIREKLKKNKPVESEHDPKTQHQ